MKELSQTQFETEIQGDKPVLVDFWAPWCVHCRRIAPALESIEAETVPTAVNITPNDMTNAPSSNVTMTALSSQHRSDGCRTRHKYSPYPVASSYTTASHTHSKWQA